MVLFQPGTASALDQSRIAESRDVGATGVFEAELDGRKLTFRLGADGFTDNETESVWNVLGQAVSGPLAGKTLTPIVHGNHFWFAWAPSRRMSWCTPGAGRLERNGELPLRQSASNWPLGLFSPTIPAQSLGL